METIKRWWNESFYGPLRKLPPLDQLLCIIVGLVGGLFPLPALTTGVTLLMGGIMSLSAPQVAVACAVNIAVTPLEIFLIPYLAKLAGAFTGADIATFTATHLMDSISDGFVALLKSASSMIIHATMAWGFLATVALVGMMAATTRYELKAKQA